MADKEHRQLSARHIPLPPDEAVADLLRVPPPPGKKRHGAVAKAEESGAAPKKSR